MAYLGCFAGLHAGKECMLAQLQTHLLPHHDLHPLVEGCPLLVSEDPAAS